MKLVTKEWEITIDVFDLKAKHLGCDEETVIFNIDGHSSPLIKDHDENSYCVCKCTLTSPRLKEFEIIAESIEVE